MYIKKKNNQNKIRTIFYTKDQIIKEYWFDITSTMRDIFNYFENHIKEGGYTLKSSYKIFGKKINEFYTISELIKKAKNDTVLEGELWLEVENEKYYDDDNDEKFYTIMQPKINPFEIIEYNSLKSKIKIIKFPKDLYLYFHFYKFSIESAFCNSINSLYMSGGEMEGKPVNNFWIINKNNYRINKKNMPISKKYHSMLYIPDNFILIAGGDTLNTTIFDIENEEFINWANMNKKHFQPALLIFGDYVYAFSALNNLRENSNYFEKTNLTSKNPKWEIIYPKFDSNIKMNSNFFGISKFCDEKILFLGGEKNNPSYIYNLADNIISISDGNNISIPFWDKTFYKINKYYNVCIPLSFYNNYKMIFFDKEKASIIEANCDKKSGFVKFNLEKDDNPGNVYIQSTFRNMKTNKEIYFQIGINPKQSLNKLKNGHNNNDEFNNNINFKNNQNFNYMSDNEDYKLDEGEIIIDTYYDNTNNVEMANPGKSNKKSYFYIPETFVNEQIINRKVNIHNNQNDNKKINKEKDESNNKDDANGFFKGQDLDKEEFIFKVDLNKDEIIKYFPSSKAHTINKKQYFYIPNSVIEDQIMNRELILNKNENKIGNNSKNNIIDEESPKKEINNNEIIENEIINCENSFKQNDIHKVMVNKSKKLFFIPYTSIDDQIIYRKIEDINNNNEKEEKEILNCQNSFKQKDYHKVIQNKSKKILLIPYTSIDDQIIYRKIEDINNNEIDEKDIINCENNFAQNDESKFTSNKRKEILFIPYTSIDDQIIYRNIEDINNNEIDEKEIINWEDSFKKNDIHKVLPNKNKQILFIPYTSIDDQIIYRKIQGINNNEIDEKEIINYVNSSLQNSDNKVIPNKNKKILFIPYSSIDDQIIYRKIEVDENQIKKENSLIDYENPKPYIQKKIVTKLSQYSDGKSNGNLENENINYFQRDNDEIKVNNYPSGNKI